MKTNKFNRVRVGISIPASPWLSQAEYEDITGFNFFPYEEGDGTRTSFSTFEKVCRNVLDQITQHMIPTLGGVVADFYIPKVPLKWPDQFLVKRALAFYIYEIVNDIRTPYEIIRDFSVRMGNYSNTWGLLSYEKLKSFIPKQSMSDLVSIQLRTIFLDNNFHENYYSDNTLQANLQIELSYTTNTINEEIIN